MSTQGPRLSGGGEERRGKKRKGKGEKRRVDEKVGRKGKENRRVETDVKEETRVVRGTEINSTDVTVIGLNIDEGP